MVWSLPVSLCDLCALCGLCGLFLNITAKHVEHAKVLKSKSLLPPPSTFLCDLCGSIWKRLTVRLSSAKVDEKK